MPAIIILVPGAESRGWKGWTMAIYLRAKGSVSSGCPPIRPVPTLSPTTGPSPLAPFLTRLLVTCGASWADDFPTATWHTGGLNPSPGPRYSASLCVRTCSQKATREQCGHIVSLSLDICLKLSPAEPLSPRPVSLPFRNLSRANSLGQSPRQRCPPAFCSGGNALICTLLFCSH